MNDKDREEFIIMKSDINHTKNDINDIKKDVKQINDNMSKITISLFNDDLTGSEGIIQATRRNGINISELQNIKKAMLFIFAATVSGLTWIIKSIF